jgi:hypothetical protein
MKYTLLEKLNLLLFIPLLFASLFSLITYSFAPGYYYFMLSYTLILTLVILNFSSLYYKYIIISLLTIIMIILTMLYIKGFWNFNNLDLSFLTLSSIQGYFSTLIGLNINYTQNIYTILLGCFMMFSLPIILTLNYLIKIFQKNK